MCHFVRFNIQKEKNVIYFIRQECLESYKSKCWRLNDDEHVKNSKYLLQWWFTK